VVPLEGEVVVTVEVTVLVVVLSSVTVDVEAGP